MANPGVELDDDELEDVPVPYADDLGPIARAAAPAEATSADDLSGVPRATATPAKISRAGLDYYQAAQVEAEKRRAALREAQAELAARKMAEAEPIQARYARLAATPTGEPPPAPPTPAPPTRRFRPFLQGTPGERPEQALNRVMFGLGTMAMQAAGIFNGFPNGALQAFTGAMQGWAAGDRQRGDAEFQNWKNRVEAAQVEWRNARQEFADTLAAKHASLEDLQLSLKGVLAKYDMPTQLYALMDKDITAGLAQAEKLGEMLRKMETDGAKIEMHRYVADLKAGTDRDVAAIATQRAKMVAEEATKRAGLTAAAADARNKETIQSREKLAGEARAARAADIRAQIEQNDRDLAERRRHNLATEGLAKDKAAGKGKDLPQKVVSEMVGYRQIVNALDDVAEAYRPEFVGPGAGRAGAMRAKYTGPKPGEAEFRAKLAHVRNTILYLRSGKQINEREADRLLAELPVEATPSGTFLSNLSTARGLAANGVELPAKMWAAQGYAVSPELGTLPPMRQPKAGQPAAPTGGGDRVIIRPSDGKEFKLRSGYPLPEGWRFKDQAPAAAPAAPAPVPAAPAAPPAAPAPPRVSSAGPVRYTAAEVQAAAQRLYPGRSMMDLIRDPVASEAIGEEIDRTRGQ